MSAVVHTGSSEARSACGMKVMVFSASARTMCGAASAAAPARPPLTMVRRGVDPHVFLPVSRLPDVAGIRPVFSCPSAHAAHPGCNHPVQEDEAGASVLVERPD